MQPHGGKVEDFVSMRVIEAHKISQPLSEKKIQVMTTNNRATPVYIKITGCA